MFRALVDTVRGNVLAKLDGPEVPMNTRDNLITASIVSFLLLHSPAHAQTEVSDAIVSRIEEEGYTVSEIRRSWLGRIVITAHKGTELREVVLNRTSGEVLRDQNFPNSHKDHREPKQPKSDEPPSSHSKPDGRGKPDGPAGPAGPGGNPGGKG